MESKVILYILCGADQAVSRQYSSTHTHTSSIQDTYMHTHNKRKTQESPKATGGKKQNKNPKTKEQYNES